MKHRLALTAHLDTTTGTQPSGCSGVGIPHPAA